MAARTIRLPANQAHRRIGLWRDLRRDWRRWSRAERVAAPIALGVLVAATFPILWLVAS